MLVTGITYAYGEENASNPLAAVNNTDVRWQYFDLDGPERNDFYLDGAYMILPKLKLKYDLHCWNTDVTGSSESDLESLHVKPIYFPKHGKLGTWKYRLAVGAELILDFGNEDKGIGSGLDQIAPLVGIALMPGGGTVLIPLVQHLVEYDGPDVNQTAFRLIAIKPLPNKWSIGVPLFIHPYKGWRFAVAPGLEHRESDDELLFRMGVAYKFMLSKRWIMSPSLPLTCGW